MSNKRNWSLPGGRLERGETLSQELIREMKEETELDVEIVRMLYLCDVAASSNTILHITFLLRKLDGKIKYNNVKYNTQKGLKLWKSNANTP